MTKIKKILKKIALPILIAIFCIVFVVTQQTVAPLNPITESLADIKAEDMTISASVVADKDAELVSEDVNTGEKTENNTESDSKESEDNEDHSDESKEQPNDKKDDLDKDDNVNEEGDSNVGDESILPDGNKELSVVTDLKSGTIKESQLRDDKLEFYAYLVNAEKNMSLKIKVVNKNTPQNGSYLTASGKNYETKLAKGNNRITIYIKQNNVTVGDPISFNIVYTADKADESRPQIGEHPPVITTNLDGRTSSIKNRNFIFNVKAVTYKGKTLPYDNIEVTFDGKLMQDTPTGSGTFEYDLYFKKPNVGDVSNHVVTVMAWDNEGNSTFKKFNVKYEFIDSGDQIGTASITIDATTLGLGIIASEFEYQIKQDVPASYAVMEALEYYGFEGDYSGSLDVGFYLKSISAKYIANGSKVPDNLWQKILDDELTLTGQKSKHKISEFDYTEGSGWMYSIDGELYPGRGLSSYYLEDGQHLILRFTLAYGKDLGGTSSKGVLSSYCGIWINDKYIPKHTMGDEKIVKEPTCDEEGLKCSSCTAKGCKEQSNKVIIPATGHHYKEIERVEPGKDAGYIKYQCETCNQIKTETILKEGA